MNNGRHHPIMPKLLVIAALVLAVLTWILPDSTAFARRKKVRRRSTTASKSAKRGRKGARSGQPGVKHYTFEDMLVDGEVLKPQMLYTKVLDRAKFERLLRLRKSFLRRMLKTYRYPCLRRGW